MRWRIPAQLIGGGVAAQAKRALVCYLGGHELPAERQSVMNQLLKRGGRLAALAKRQRIPAMMARVARP
ncbi:hypothetical protein B7G55_06910 [Aeromonas hydrophila]|nr:hypothetical protein B7G55_06910 [Aeromonas hydrophila]